MKIVMFFIQLVMGCLGYIFFQNVLTKRGTYLSYEIYNVVGGSVLEGVMQSQSFRGHAGSKLSSISLRIPNVVTMRRAPYISAFT